MMTAPKAISELSRAIFRARQEIALINNMIELRAVALETLCASVLGQPVKEEALLHALEIAQASEIDPWPDVTLGQLTRQVVSEKMNGHPVHIEALFREVTRLQPRFDNPLYNRRFRANLYVLEKKKVIRKTAPAMFQKI